MCLLHAGLSLMGKGGFAWTNPSLGGVYVDPRQPPPPPTNKKRPTGLLILSSSAAKQSRKPSLTYIVCDALMPKSPLSRTLTPRVNRPRRHINLMLEIS